MFERRERVDQPCRTDCACGRAASDSIRPSLRCHPLESDTEDIIIQHQPVPVLICAAALQRDNIQPDRTVAHELSEFALQSAARASRL